MRKKFMLEGLNCANCAAKIERDITKLEGVESASINLMTEKLIVEGAEDMMSQIAIMAEKIVNKYEPEVRFKTA
ncbi:MULTISPECIES: cation transporter [unclassified Sedimentibacter]|uniref:cation transporter n=1 Tax=unclassified Sedimentibacter TaxID=2649220 RepID=UPI0027E0435A|nr:cation transporter [Sedimentibacter sp. MB35-C1]WMJ78852.1 cation transporter [Sedimentibacter sp. MB35-C1]